MLIARQATQDDLYAGYVPFLSWWLVYDPDEESMQVFPNEQLARDYIEDGA